MSGDDRTSVGARFTACGSRLMTCRQRRVDASGARWLDSQSRMAAAQPHCYEDQVIASARMTACGSRSMTRR